MCLHIESELRNLDAEATGSMTDAQAQRLIHATLYQAVMETSRRSDYDAYGVALARWNGHIDEHKRQARAIRAGRRK